MCEKKENRVSLPSYAWSPWKEGRSKEEQRELQEIQEIRIPDGVRELGNYTFYGWQESGDFGNDRFCENYWGRFFYRLRRPAETSYAYGAGGEPLVSGMWSVKLSMKSMFPSCFGTAGREQS